MGKASVPGKALSKGAKIGIAGGAAAVVAAVAVVLVIVLGGASAAFGSLDIYGGGSAPGYSDGLIADAYFNTPTGIAVAQNGIIITDSGNGLVRGIIGGESAVTLAGSLDTKDGYGRNEGGFTDGDAESALMGSLGYICAVGEKLYFIDSENSAIKEYDGTNVTTYATCGAIDGYSEDMSVLKYGATYATMLLNPTGITADSDGNLYVSDTGHNTIIKINTDGTYELFAGVPGQSGYSDGTCKSALFCEPTAIVYADGAIYVADSGNNLIRKIENGSVTTYAGGVDGTDEITGRPEGGDSTGRKTRFFYPTGIDYADGVLFVADSGNNKIKAVLDDGTSVLLYGGKCGFAVGSGTDALLNYPTDVLYTDGILYVCDSGNNAIRCAKGDISELKKETRGDFEAEKLKARQVVITSVLIADGGSNDAIVKRGAEELEAYEGMRITAGDTVVSGYDTAVIFTIDSDKSIRLENCSEMRITSANSKQMTLSLNSGAYYYVVENPLEDGEDMNFTAGGTTMSIRGTEGYVYIPVTIGETSVWRSGLSVSDTNDSADAGFSSGSRTLSVQPVMKINSEILTMISDRNSKVLSVSEGSPIIIKGNANDVYCYTGNIQLPDIFTDSQPEEKPVVINIKNPDEFSVGEVSRIANNSTPSVNYTLEKGKIEVATLEVTEVLENGGTIKAEGVKNITINKPVEISSGEQKAKTVIDSKNKPVSIVITKDDTSDPVYKQSDAAVNKEKICTHIFNSYYLDSNGILTVNQPEVQSCTSALTEFSICRSCNEKHEIKTAPTGHTYVKTEDAKYLKSAATCTSRAVYYLSCSGCGEKSTETFEAGEVLAHTYENITDSRYLKSAATCKSVAVYYKSCKVCGAAGSETFEAGQLAAHEPAAAVAENNTGATCTVPGSYESVVYCRVCRAEISRTKVQGEVLPHSYIEKVTSNGLASAANCTDKAKYYKVCENCGGLGTETFEYGSALGHKAGVVLRTEIKEATCTSAGSYTEVTTCRVCDRQYKSEKKTVPMLNHSWAETVSDNLIAKEATCTTRATYWNSCSVCGAKGSETFESGSLKAHTPVTVPGRAATCTASGLTDGEKCSVCNSVITEQKQIPKLDHIPVTDAAVPATCTATGLTEGSHCSVCKAVLKAQETVDAAGHTPVTDAAVPATCTTAGLTEGSHCSVCKAVIVKQNTVAMTAHTQGDEVQENYVAASCTSSGSYDKVVRCTVCNTQISSKHVLISAHGHTVTYTANGDATCTYAGTESGTCSECGMLFTREAEGVVGGHTPGTPVTENLIEADCVTAGSYDEVIYCTSCLEEISRTPKTIKALGHAFTEKNTGEDYLAKAADCTSAATYYYKCVRCTAKGTETFEYGDMLEHSYTAETVADKYLKSKATCIAKTVYYKSCATCGLASETETFEFGELADHTPGAAVTENSVEPDCVTAGSYDEVIYCTVCKTEISRTPKTVSALGHAFTEKNTSEAYLAKAADCTSAATYYYKCVRCTAKGTETFEYGDMLEHSYTAETVADKYLKSEATCTEKAVYYKSCATCGLASGTETFEYGDMLEHSYTAETVADKYLKSKATCTAKTVYYKSCATCGLASETETFEFGELADHTPGAAVTENSVEPDCVTAGSYDEVVYCTVCKTEISRTSKTVSALGHTPGTAVEENRSEPDCVAAGSYDEVVYCTVCSAEISRTSRRIAPLGHVSQLVAEVPATCDTTGTSAYYLCTRCQGKFADEECLTRISDDTALVIPLHASTLTHVDAVAATCENPGNAEYWYCECKKIFADDRAQKELTWEDIFTEALGHEYVYVAAVEKCLDDGTDEYYKCSRTDCGKLFSVSYAETGERIPGEEIEVPGILSATYSHMSTIDTDTYDDYYGYIDPDKFDALTDKTAVDQGGDVAPYTLYLVTDTCKYCGYKFQNRLILDITVPAAVDTTGQTVPAHRELREYNEYAANATDLDAPDAYADVDNAVRMLDFTDLFYGQDGEITKYNTEITEAPVELKYYMLYFGCPEWFTSEAAAWRATTGSHVTVDETFPKVSADGLADDVTVRCTLYACGWIVSNKG